MLSETLEKVTKSLNDFWDKRDKKSRWVVVCTTLAVVTCLVVAILLASRTEYTVLFRDLDPKEAGEIMARLEDMGENAKPKGNRTIMVPKNDADRLAMELASQDYPKSGFNYDVYSEGTGFGRTESDKNTYMKFQLQERLQTALTYMDNIEDAIVNLHIPERTLTVLQSERDVATASVLLKLRPGFELLPGQVKAVEQLVQKSVQGLLPDNISVIDTNMKEYSSHGTGVEQMAGTQLEIMNKHRAELEKVLKEKLEPPYGIGKIVVGVNVLIDFSERDTKRTSYEGVGGSDTGIVVSENTQSETATNRTDGGVAGADPNGENDVTQYPAGGGQGGDYSTKNTTRNYNVNEIIETVRGAGGSVTDITASIIINKETMTDEEINNVRELAANIIGQDINKVVVKNMVFDDTIARQFEEANQERLSRERIELMRSAAIMGLFALVILIGIILAYRLLKKKQRSDDIETIGTLLEEQTPVLNDMDYANFEDLKRNTYKEQIEEFIDRSPDSVAQLLRNWLSED